MYPGGAPPTRDEKRQHFWLSCHQTLKLPLYLSSLMPCVHYTTSSLFCLYLPLPDPDPLDSSYTSLNNPSKEQSIKKKLKFLLVYHFGGIMTKSTTGHVRMYGSKLFWGFALVVFGHILVDRPNNPLSA